MKAIALLLLLSIGQVNSPADNDEEHPVIRSSSKVFIDSAPSSLNTISRSELSNRFETPSLNASSDSAFKELLTEINSRKPIPELGVGEKGKKYDVILQPGHYLRTKGAVGTQGALTSEQALAAFITGEIAKNLRKAKKSVLVISADQYLHPSHSTGSFDGLQSTIFLAIHADGSAHPCSTGPSMAYQVRTSPLAMHAIGLGLADALGYDYTDFRKDNYTVNEGHYYMFRNVQTDRLNGLLEVGELTCNQSELRLIGSSRMIGANVARAIEFLLHSSE